ncbi:glycosyltransferase [Candidatus Daviesbacteria bacterium]|nr:glycosyltransferase [Candidatus Daviesbacteria bacterium]
MMKRISFLLATKNRAKFLEKALKNHQKLLKENDELILIDGGSSDDTIKVAKKFSKIISVFISEADISEGHAFNKGILLSSGKYIKILSDDDIFFSQAIENAYTIMEKNPDIDVLLCGGVKLRGKDLSFAYAPPGVDYGKKVSDVFKYGGCGLGLLIRKKSFALTGLFNPYSFSLDNDYITQAINSGANVKFCRIKMFHHFLEDHSGSIKQGERLRKDIARIKNRYNYSDENFFLNLRVSFSQILFPLLPKNIQTAYKKIFKLTKSKPKIKPIWDGGFS